MKLKRRKLKIFLERLSCAGAETSYVMERLCDFLKGYLQSFDQITTLTYSFGQLLFFLNKICNIFMICRRTHVPNNVFYVKTHNKHVANAIDIKNPLQKSINLIYR